jgi:hypothetical protein
MNNPLGLVLNTRTVYKKEKDRSIIEVLVKFKEEDPSWIPLETLLAIRSDS